MTGLADGTRLVIRGNPSPEEVAAVVAALDQVTSERNAGSRRRPGWLQAARREGVGGRLVRSRADLARP
jgi:hypothetical protein